MLVGGEFLRARRVTTRHHGDVVSPGAEARLFFPFSDDILRREDPAVGVLYTNDDPSRFRHLSSFLLLKGLLEEVRSISAW